MLFFAKRKASQTQENTGAFVRLWGLVCGDIDNRAGEFKLAFFNPIF